LDCSEQKAIGFLPKSVINHTGKNTSETIAGGDIRIFTIKTDGSNIEEMSFIQPLANPTKRGLTLRNISSIKEEILLRSTFFQHFDRIIIDWKYLYGKENAIISKESGWIKRQGLKLIVDFSSGINLFPDLRLVNNDSLEFLKSMKAIKSVIDKMNLLGAGDLILKKHRMIENNFSKEKYSESLQKTLKDICQYSATYKINVHLRTTSGRNGLNLEQASALIHSVKEPNFYIAPVTALILKDPQEVEKNIALLKNLKFRLFLVGAPEEDLFGTHWNNTKAIINFPDQQVLKKLFFTVPGSIMVLEGVYHGPDEEYMDVKILDNLENDD
jgi:hypothetical protein